MKEKEEVRMMKEEGIPLGMCVTPRTEKATPVDFPDEIFLGLDDIEAHTTRLLGTKPCTSMKSAAKRFYPGDVLYSRLRPYLNKVWLADRTGLCSSEFIVVPSNDHFDGAFLKYRINAMDFVSFANSLNAGDRPRVDFEQISSFCLPLFSLARQRRIVAKIEELFSELDAGEENLRVARRQLVVYRQSLLKQAFEGKLTEKWRTQNPDKLEAPASLLARIQSERQTERRGDAISHRSRKKAAEIFLESRLVESLPQLPDSWQWTALGNLTHLITKGSSPKWQGFDYTNDPSGVLFVTSENVRTGFLDLSRPKYLALGFNEIQPASVLQNGDVLLNIVGASIGRAATFYRTTLANINQAVSVIRPAVHLDRTFLTFHLNSSRTYQLVTSKAVDVARANFSLADVNEIPVPLCSLPEQQEIVRLLDEQFEVIERNEQEIDAALKRSAALRQSILKKAFTGQLVLQDPDDEPAYALLERIRKERVNTPAKDSKKKPFQK